MDPLELRLANAAREGTKAAYGPKFREIGYAETVEAGARPRALPGRARTRTRAAGSPPASGSTSAGKRAPPCTSTRTAPRWSWTRTRTSAARARRWRSWPRRCSASTTTACVPSFPDTSSIPYSDMTGGSRVTFSVGMAVVEAAKKVLEELRNRAAKVWEVDPEGVWFGRTARRGPRAATSATSSPSPSPPSRRARRRPGGPNLRDRRRSTRVGSGPGFGTHLCDVEVDPNTGRGHRASLYRHPGRRPGHPPELRRGAAPGRGGARESAGPSTRSTSTARREPSRTRASSTTGSRSPRTFR